jgi:tetratricopeptide (TPR) repeat protein
MGVHGKSVRVLVSVVMLVAAPALADYDAALSAFEAEDFNAAREELSSLEAGDDSRVHLLLGVMNRDGQGGPVDLREAYRNLTLAAMYAEDGDTYQEALGERSVAAREMSAEEIVSGEQLVTATVTSRLTEERLRQEIESIHDALVACPSRCGEIAIRVLELGPAAGALAPDLEALMTRDPFWLPRDLYAVALVSIGTQAVPSLARILLDEAELKGEGFYNLQLASAGLSQLGPTAFSARETLLQALEIDYSGSGGEYGKFFSAMGAGSPADMIRSVKASILTTIAAVGDPERESHARLYSYMEREPDDLLRLITAGAIAASYDELQPVGELLRKSLGSGSGSEQTLALAMIWDLAARPEADGLVEDLQPLVRQLTASADPDVQSKARETMELYIADLVSTAIDSLLQDDYPAAIAIADAAIERDPWSGFALEVRAEAKRQSGDIAGAISDINRSMEVEGDSYSVQIALERAGAWDGGLTGEVDDAVRAAMEACLRDDACFEGYRSFE